MLTYKEIFRCLKLFKMAKFEFERGKVMFSGMLLTLFPYS